MVQIDTKPPLFYIQGYGAFIFMKTAVTVINTVQVGIDEYRDLKTTKIFDDDTTIGEIKDWIIKERKLKLERDKIGISGTDFSDVVS